MQNTDISNATTGAPELLDAAEHAVVDYLAAGGLITLGFSLLGVHRRAATLAFITGGLALGTSLFTDYPGGVFRKLSFKTHGMIDAMHAAMCAALPAAMGFGGDKEAQIFHAQAVFEAGVVAVTDWEAVPRLQA